MIHALKSTSEAGKEALATSGVKPVLSFLFYVLGQARTEHSLDGSSNPSGLLSMKYRCWTKFGSSNGRDRMQNTWLMS
jgi:hypothetical protein